MLIIDIRFMFVFCWEDNVFGLKRSNSLTKVTIARNVFFLRFSVAIKYNFEYV